MKPMPSFLPALVLLVSILLSACADRPTEIIAPTASATSTPDPCAPGNIVSQIDKVNRHMREFDDASALAASTPRDQLRPAIAELQRIRRAAEDLDVPACLTNLKKYQVAHMNLVISSLLAFMGGAEQQTVTEGIQRSRQLHDQYTLEIARLMGITLVPVTQSPSSAPAAGASTPAGNFVINPGPATVNMRAAPAWDALNLGLLDVGQTAVAIGRTADNQWFLIEMPGASGQTAWVFASLVTLSGPVDVLTVVTPAP